MQHSFISKNDHREHIYNSVEVLYRLARVVQRTVSHLFFSWR